jgi:hypothetical protein
MKYFETIILYFSTYSDIAVLMNVRHARVNVPIGWHKSNMEHPTETKNVTVYE